MTHKEEWKDIKEYEGKYQISNLGNVKALDYKRTKKEKILKPRINSTGYMVVNLYKNAKFKTFKIHRLIAQAFIINPENKPCINHIDGNKLNNSIDNLEWCTYRENTIHAIKNGLASSPKPRYGLDNYKAKSVKQYSLDGKFIKHWDCIREASKYLNATHISDVCKGKRKSSKGFIWRYSTKENLNLIQE